MTFDIIGRVPEKKRLKEIYDSGQPEFLAIYGRRRVGKTYLIRNFFEEEGLFLEVTGQKGAATSVQLGNFSLTLGRTFGDQDQTVLKNWNEALSVLSQRIEALPGNEKKILFFDELPWLAGRRSGFMAALDYFWNTWASRRADVIVIVCGSAASWMINNVIHQKGGLHNRITSRMRLLPFNLAETEDYLKYRHINYSRKQIIETYMAIGGVPFYLRQLSRGLSPAQNLNHICFSKDGVLADELKLMFASLFDQADKYIDVVRLLARKRSGITRKRLLQGLGRSTGGGITTVLNGLEESGFITKHVPYKKATRDILYQLSDEYTFFYFHWIETAPRSVFTSSDSQYWNQCQQSRRWDSWAGFSFESVCLKHVYGIKKALGINGISALETTWRCRNSEDGGAQVDLLIDRSDNCINICEIKFSNGLFELKKSYAEKLMATIERFRSETGIRKTCFLTFITTYGLKNTPYVEHYVDNHITMDALFE